MSQLFLPQTLTARDDSKMAHTDLKTELTNAGQQIYCLKPRPDRCAYFRCFLSETAHYVKHPSESYTISGAKRDNQGTDIQWNPLPVYVTTCFLTTIFFRPKRKNHPEHFKQPGRGWSNVR